MPKLSKKNLNIRIIKAKQAQQMEREQFTLKEIGDAIGMTYEGARQLLLWKTKLDAKLKRDNLNINKKVD